MNYIINEYTTHQNLYVSIYALINLCILINIFFVNGYSRRRNYKLSFLMLFQSFILNIGMIMFSVVNVLVINQYVNFEKLGMVNYQYTFLAFNFLGFILFLISIVCILINYNKNKHKIFVNY